MITDPFPRAAPGQRQYLASDQLPALALPADEPLRSLTGRLFDAIAGGERADIAAVAADLLGAAAPAFRAVVPEIKILGVRPHKIAGGVCTYQLFGDYDPASHRIRIWLKTAVREQVCAPRTFLATLLHELAHHLDCTVLDLPESFHTRGFFGRVDDLYHHALGTPAEERRRLAWVKSGPVWRIDWARTRAPGGPR